MIASHIDSARSIHGWMSNTELTWLAQMARESKVIIEVGCYLGRSTKCLADNTLGVVYAVDPWEKFYPDNEGNKHCIEPNVYPQFQKNLQEEIQTGKVIPVKEFFTYMPIKADFIFLDGDHREDSVSYDIEVAESMILKGGIIAGHDYGHRDWPGVKKAVDYHYGKPVEIIDSIWAVRY